MYYLHASTPFPFSHTIILLLPLFSFHVLLSLYDRFSLSPWTHYHLLLTRFWSAVTFPCAEPCKLTRIHFFSTHTSWIINNTYCSRDSSRLLVCPGRLAWLTQSRPHMGPLPQTVSLHVISHHPFFQHYIWPHLLTIATALLHFVFIAAQLTPLYFLILFLSHCLPCGVSIWRSESEGHSNRRGGLEREG